jgi:hypothetical protein
VCYRAFERIVGTPTDIALSTYQFVGEGLEPEGKAVRVVRNRRPVADFWLILPDALSALSAFKYMDHDSTFRLHDRFEESEPSSAETAVMI